MSSERDCDPLAFALIEHSSVQQEVTTQGTLQQVGVQEGSNFYYKFPTITPPIQGLAQLNSTTFLITKTNIYSFEFGVLPLVSSSSFQLPLEVQTNNGGLTPEEAGLQIETTHSPFLVRMEGTFPTGTRIRAYSLAKYLKLFSSLEVSVIVGKSTALETLTEYERMDSLVKVEYIPERPLSVDSRFPLQHPLTLTTPTNPGIRYLWNIDVIPSQEDQLNNEIFETYEKPYPPEVLWDEPEASQVKIKYNEVYNKSQSQADVLNFYLGVNTKVVCPFAQSLSLFQTNLEARGKYTYPEYSSITPGVTIDNSLKYNYMAAISYDKLAYYEDKIDAFLSRVYNLVASGQPVLSSFLQQLVPFYLTIHVGYDDYPKYVLDYFTNFVNVVFSLDPLLRGWKEAMIYGNSVSSKVRAYFLKRGTRIAELPMDVQRQTIYYWWKQYGLDDEKIVSEIVYNVYHFAQLTNVMNLFVRNSVENPGYPLAGGDSTTYIEEYRRATSTADDTVSAVELNVVREFFRLSVPCPSSYSLVGEENYEDPSKMVRSRHLHQLLMIQKEGWETYSNIDFSVDGRYKDWRADFDDIDERPLQNCPHQRLHRNSEDKETLMNSELSPGDNVANVIPVFLRDEATSYLPFNVGYRRCAGETLTYFITQKLFDKFHALEYELREAPESIPTVIVSPQTIVSNNLYAK